MKELVAKLIASAALNLYKAQPNLSRFVQRETSEREPNLCFHFTNELWKYLFWLECDFDVSKDYHRDQRPDIIFHRRESNALNFLVIEVKRSTNLDGYAGDLDKIRDEWLTPNLSYRFGASVVLDVENKDFEIRLLSQAEPDCHSPFTKAHLRKPMRRPWPTAARCQAFDSLAAEMIEARHKDDTADISTPSRALDELIKSEFSYV